MSYVVLTIDTQAPEVTIYSPSYTTQDVVNIITIEANEPIADYQEIYIIDSQNNRHDYTFLKESENQYVGRVRFNDLPLGVATIYARVKDTVNNFSNTAIKSFEIKKSLFKGNIEIGHRPFRNVDVSDSKMGEANVSDSIKNKVEVVDYSMKSETKDYSMREVNVDDKSF